MSGALRKKNGSAFRRKTGRVMGDPLGGGGSRNERRQIQKEIERAIAAHPCGTCDACCTVKAVQQIGKLEGVRCEHLHEEGSEQRLGCQIYKDRPQSCRDYFCSYRYGIVGDDVAIRPDHIGLLFDIAEAPPPGVLMLSVREVVVGAIDEHMKELNELVAERGYVLYLMRGEKRHFMGPEEKVRACHEWSRRHLPLVAR